LVCTLKYKILKIILIVLINIGLFVAWNSSYKPIKYLILKSNLPYKVFGISVFDTDISESYIKNDQKVTDILHYNLKIDLYPSGKIIKGDVTLTGVIKNDSLNQLDLNFYDNFKIQRIFFNGNPVDKYTCSGTDLSIPVSVTKKDTFDLRIIYEGTPESKGLGSFAFDKFNGKSIVYTLSEPVYASTWFPCNDKPDDKALMDIYITNDSSKVSVSNGILIETITNKERRTYHWKTIYPLSTYLVCMYSADYKNFRQNYTNNNNSKIDLEYYVLPEHLEMAKTDFSEHPEMMKYFEDTFGLYPFEKEKYGVAEFMWQMGAMEHQTITGIGSNFINGKKMFNEYYVHELAHQWWGDAVGLKTWKDIWLNEGFASYSEALYAEHKAGFNAYKSTMIEKYSDNFTGKLYNPDYLFSSTVYNKGAYVLHMLRFEVGDSLFFKILKEYYNQYKYSNASTSDFIHLCEKVTNRDLDFFFSQWIFDGEGMIEVRYNTKILNSKNNIEIDFEQIQNAYQVYKFPVEILFKMDDSTKSFTSRVNITRRTQSFSFELRDKLKEVIIDPNKWLLAKFVKE
jgi:aminopeptidase N